MAKSFGNLTQAFEIMTNIVNQRRSENSNKLFVFMDTMYSAFKMPGGTTWWQYDESLDLI